MLGDRNRLLVFAVTALPVLMGAIDSTIVVVALPAMLEDLHTNLSWLGWTITIYMLVTTIVMPLSGRIGDDFGRKRVFIAMALVFTVSSILAGLAPNVQWLIFFRVIQALGGGAFMPIGAGIVADEFPGQRARMIGLLSTIYPIGGIIGPNIGGWLVGQYHWRYIFYINVPIGIFVALLGYVVLRETRPRGHSRIDLKGGGLLSGTVLSFMYALTRLGEIEDRLGDPLVWLSIVAGGLFLLWFVRHESRVEGPILDIALLRWRPFVATNVLNFFLGACAFSTFSLVPIYAVTAYNLSAWESGALLTPRSIGTIAMVVVSSFLLDRLGYRLPIIAGLLVVGLGVFLLGQGYHGATILGLAVGDFVLLASAVAVAGLGMGMLMPATNNAAIELMPNRIGAITGLRGMFRSMGGIVGTSTALLVLSLYEDKALGYQAVFTSVAVMFVVLAPLALVIPDRAGVLQGQASRDA